jgi:enoyl-CoA hydratase/carnithine racemase
MAGERRSAGRFLVTREEIPGGGRLARLEIDNRKKGNSLGRALLSEIALATEGLGADPQLRAAILTGTGERAFSGGADLEELAALDPESARAFITLVHRCCEAFRRLPAPVIARVDGHALGLGLELLCSCDLRVASARSRFGMPEVRVGIPSVVEAALLPRLIGSGRARRLILTGETIDADTAAAWGLVDAVVPAAGLDAEVERFLAAILAAGPRAIRLQKALMREWEELPASAAIVRGIAVFAEAYKSAEPEKMASAMLALLKGRR